MATYYVRTDGDDSNDGLANNADAAGTENQAWKTINKAATTISAGDVVNIGDGTYSEDSGSGYLNFNRDFRANRVTFQSTSGVAANVIIKGSGVHATYNVMIGGTNVGGYLFKNLTLESVTNACLAPIRNANGCSNIEFNGVVFRTLYNAAQANYGLFLVPNSTNVIDNVTLNGTSVVAVGGNANVIGYNFARAAAGDTLSNVTITNAVAENVNRGLICNGVVGLTITGGRFAGIDAHAVYVGSDSGTIYATTGVSITGGTVARGGHTHGCLIGRGVDGAAIDDLIVYGGDFGLVLKGCNAVVVRCAIAYGGTPANGVNGTALYFKGATNSSVTDSIIIAHTGTDGVVKMAYNDTDANAKTQNVTLTGNLIVAKGTVNVYYWNGDTHDAGGCVVNGNRYLLLGTGNFGAVRGDASVANLAELRTAWADYGDGSNDKTSYLPVKQRQVLLGA